MNNGLPTLNEYLFGAMEAITNPDLTGAELEQEIKRTDAIADLSDKIIANASLALKIAEKTSDGALFGVKKPAMLQVGTSDEEI